MAGGRWDPILVFFGRLVHPRNPKGQDKPKPCSVLVAYIEAGSHSGGALFEQAMNKGAAARNCPNPRRGPLRPIRHQVPHRRKQRAWHREQDTTDCRLGLDLLTEGPRMGDPWDPQPISRYLPRGFVEGLRHGFLKSIRDLIVQLGDFGQLPPHGFVRCGLGKATKFLGLAPMVSCTKHIHGPRIRPHDGQLLTLIQGQAKLRVDRFWVTPACCEPRQAGDHRREITGPMMGEGAGHQVGPGSTAAG